MARRLTEHQRFEILGMLKSGLSVPEIARKCGVDPTTIRRIKKKVDEQDGELSTQWKGGRPTEIDYRTLGDKIRKRVERNPERSIRQLALDFGVSRWTIEKCLDKLGLKTYSALVRQDIMPGQEIRRLERATGLLKWRQTGSNSQKTVLWSDEKWFFVQKAFNRRNTRFILKVRDPENEKRIVRVRKNPAKVMVFGLMGSDGKSMPPIFIPANESVTTDVYLTRIMPAVRDWIRENYGQGQTVFMQDDAPAHTSNRTQAWLVQELGENGFWGKNMWPPSSPDANPLDFSFWSELARKVCETEPKNRNQLIIRIEEQWTDILEPEYVRKTCAAAWERLRRIVDARGSFIEGLDARNPDLESSDEEED